MDQDIHVSFLRWLVHATKAHPDPLSRRNSEDLLEHRCQLLICELTALSSRLIGDRAADVAMVLEFFGLLHSSECSCSDIVLHVREEIIIVPIRHDAKVACSNRAGTFQSFAALFTALVMVAA